MQVQVLVLNANFEPINVCNTRRAIGLILSGKAALVTNGRGYIHTVSQNYPRPSVIRLEHMVQRARPRVKLTSQGSVPPRWLYLPILRASCNRSDH